MAEINCTEEIFVIVPFNGRYRVSNIGRVQSRRSGEWLDIKQQTDRGGYRYVGLSYGKRGSVKLMKVHRLVLAAFRGMSPLQCRHLDGNRSNNRLSNLAYGTAIENSQDRDRHGTTRKGRFHGMARLNPIDVARVKAIDKLLMAGIKQRHIAAAIGVSPIFVKSVRQGITGAYITGRKTPGQRRTEEQKESRRAYLRTRRTLAGGSA